MASSGPGTHEESSEESEEDDGGSTGERRPHERPHLGEVHDRPTQHFGTAGVGGIDGLVVVALDHEAIGVEEMPRLPNAKPDRESMRRLALDA